MKVLVFDKMTTLITEFVNRAWMNVSQKIVIILDVPGVECNWDASACRPASNLCTLQGIRIWYYQDLNNNKTVLQCTLVTC